MGAKVQADGLGLQRLLANQGEISASQTERDRGSEQSFAGQGAATGIQADRLAGLIGTTGQHQATAQLQAVGRFQIDGGGFHGATCHGGTTIGGWGRCAAEFQAAASDNGERAEGGGADVALDLGGSCGGDAERAPPQTVELNGGAGDRHRFGLHLNPGGHRFRGIHRPQRHGRIQLADGAGGGDVVLLVYRLEVNDLLGVCCGLEG